MPKCKILKANNSNELEFKINDFISDVNIKVISVNMAISIDDEFYACIIYEEWNEV